MSNEAKRYVGKCGEALREGRLEANADMDRCEPGESIGQTGPTCELRDQASEDFCASELREAHIGPQMVNLEERVRRYEELHDRNVNFVNQLLGGAMSFVPRGNRVLVIGIEAPDHKDVERADGSTVRIEYPDNAKPSMRASRGVVLGMGPGQVLDNGERAPMDIQIGDFVQFGRFAGQRMDVPQEEQVVVGGKKLIILTIDEIHGSWQEIEDKETGARGPSALIG